MTTDAVSKAFDPREHLARLRGKEYLEVKWRLVWLRSEHPDATIATHILEHDRASKFVVVGAFVSIPGGGSATGIKSETAADFADYIEKAETGAIGRALAALGFGTQFAEDFEDGEKRGELAVKDSPVEPPGSDRHRYSNASTTRAWDTGGTFWEHVPPNGVPQRDGPLMVTEPQIRAIHAILGGIEKRTGKTVAASKADIYATHNITSLTQLTRQQATELIDTLQPRTAADGR